MICLLIVGTTFGAKIHLSIHFATPARFRNQGCQIFLGATYQNVKDIPNNHKISQITIKYTKRPQNTSNGRKTDQMAIKYTSIFHSQAL
jgi:hypothetical protein